MKNCSPSVTPIKQMQNIPYASAVGSLMYAQVCTRPDIAFAVSILGRYQSNLGIIHWRATKKVLRYLQGIKNFMLTYRRTDNLKIVEYSDSDLTGCVDSRKSTSGYIFMLADGAVSWKSAKQLLVVTSTMENFISEFKIMDCISRPLRIYCDNSAAVFMAKNNRSSSRSKHIDIKYLAIKDRVNTKQMTANPLTKGMPPGLFKDHVTSMCLCSVTSLI
ncbi:hypothetical protein AAHE18_16G065000 [Arachis hypogaea]